MRKFIICLLCFASFVSLVGCEGDWSKGRVFKIAYAAGFDDGQSGLPANASRITNAYSMHVMQAIRGYTKGYHAGKALIAASTPQNDD